MIEFWGCVNLNVSSNFANSSLCFSESCFLIEYLALFFVNLVPNVFDEMPLIMFADFLSNQI